MKTKIHHRKPSSSIILVKNQTNKCQELVPNFEQVLWANIYQPYELLPVFISSYIGESLAMYGDEKLNSRSSTKGLIQISWIFIHKYKQIHILNDRKQQNRELKGQWTFKLEEWYGNMY